MSCPLCVVNKITLPLHHCIIYKQIICKYISRNKTKALTLLVSVLFYLVAHIGLEPMTYRLSPCRSPN